MKDRHGEVIYIGKAKRLRNRVSSYFRENADHQPKVAKMVETAWDFDVIVTDSELEALVLECSLIKQHSPKYNILLKDDKGFCYVRVSNEQYPRISASLQKYNDGARYIGPYIGSYGVRRLVETANTAFRLPLCHKKFPECFGKQRPCLNAHLGLCMALCSGRISRADYLSAVDGALELITKGTDHVLAQLREKMLAASQATEYESAARYRDSIAAIERINEKQKVAGATTHSDCDAFAFAGSDTRVCAVVLKYRDGAISDKDEQIITDTADIGEARDEFCSHYYIDKEIPREILVDADFDSRAALEQMLAERRGRAVNVSIPQKGEPLAIVNMAHTNAVDALKRTLGRVRRETAANAELANLLALPQPPHIVEAYDISNYGDDAVAGMVVFADGLPRRSDYRRFKIKTVEGTDDYAAMQEVLQRRVARYDSTDAKGSFARKPDLILLDGGRGHLSAALAVLRAGTFADVPVFGMVKDDKHRTRAIVGEGGELSVAMHKNAFYYVATIQNEVHRYSLDYRRSSHSAGSFRSSLTKIDGVGETYARELIKHFKTVRAVSEASVEQLQQVAHMSERTARNIYDYFHTT